QFERLQRLRDAIPNEPISGPEPEENEPAPPDETNPFPPPNRPSDDPPEPPAGVAPLVEPGPDLPAPLPAVTPEEPAASAAASFASQSFVAARTYATIKLSRLPGKCRHVVAVCPPALPYRLFPARRGLRYRPTDANRGRTEDAGRGDDRSRQPLRRRQVL